MNDIANAPASVADPGEPSAAPPQAEPVEIKFRPTRSEYIQGYIAVLPNALAYLIMVWIIVQAANLFYNPRGLEPQDHVALGVVGVLIGLVVAFEAAYRSAQKQESSVVLDEQGVQVRRHGYTAARTWAKLSVRETASALVLFTDWPLGVVVPKRVLAAADRLALERWLAIRHVKVRRKPLASLTRALIIVGLLIAFVTWYNLMQGSQR